jgi:hypothetical protein
MRIPNKPEEPQKKEVLPSVNPNHENFNFEIWASAVRRQMLAVLQTNVSGDSPPRYISP